MIHIDLYVPQGALDAAHRARIAERLVTELYAMGDSAPAAVMAESRAMCTVLVHETGTWVTGDRTLGPDSPPRYLARVTVPEAWVHDMSTYMIGLVNRVLAAEEPAGDRLTREPHAWVQVLGLPDRTFGTQGRALGALDVVRMVTAPYRSSPGRFTPREPLAEGTGLDPVCGMTVPFQHAAATAEREGTTYAFCSAGCKELYDEEDDRLLTR